MHDYQEIVKAYFVNDPLRRAMILNVGYPVMGVVLMMYKVYSITSQESSYFQEYLVSSVVSSLIWTTNLYGISVCQTIFLMYFEKLIRIQYHVSLIIQFVRLCIAYNLCSSAIYMMIMAGMNPFLAYAIPLMGAVVIIFCAEVIKYGVDKWLRN